MPISQESTVTQAKGFADIEALLGGNSSVDKSPPVQTVAEKLAAIKTDDTKGDSQQERPVPESQKTEPSLANQSAVVIKQPSISSIAEEWHQILPNLALNGMTAEFARHCLLSAKDTETLSIDLDRPGEHLHSESTEQELKQALQRHYGHELILKITLTSISEETPAKRAKRQAEERQQQAELEIANDAFVNHLKTAYNAQIVKHSVKPR